MTDDIKSAIESLRKRFGSENVSTDESGPGVIVNIANINPGDQFTAKNCILSFIIPDSYPWSDIYPQYMTPPLERKDGGSLPSDIQHSEWNGAPASQLSRRSQSAGDSASISVVNKINRVLSWLRTI